MTVPPMTKAELNIHNIKKYSKHYEEDSKFHHQSRTVAAGHLRISQRRGGRRSGNDIRHSHEGA